MTTDSVNFLISHGDEQYEVLFLPESGTKRVPYGHKNWRATVSQLGTRMMTITAPPTMMKGKWPCETHAQALLRLLVTGPTTVKA